MTGGAAAHSTAMGENGVEVEGLVSDLKDDVREA